MVMDESRWWQVVFSRICPSRRAGSFPQWNWGMVTLLLVPRSELVLRHRIPRILPLSHLHPGVSKKPRGPQTSSWTAQSGPCKDLHHGEALSRINPSQPMGQWWGEEHVYGGGFGSSRGYWSYSSQGPFGFGSRGSLMWAGLAALTFPKPPRWKCPLWPKLSFATGVQTDDGQRSQWRQVTLSLLLLLQCSPRSLDINFFPFLPTTASRPCFLGNGGIPVLLSYGEKKDLGFYGTGSGLPSL